MFAYVWFRVFHIVDLVPSMSLVMQWLRLVNAVLASTTAVHPSSTQSWLSGASECLPGLGLGI